VGEALTTVTALRANWCIHSGGGSYPTCTKKAAANGTSRRCSVEADGAQQTLARVSYQDTSELQTALAEFVDAEVAEAILANLLWVLLDPQTDADASNGVAAKPSNSRPC